MILNQSCIQYCLTELDTPACVECFGGPLDGLVVQVCGTIKNPVHLIMHGHGRYRFAMRWKREPMLTGHIWESMKAFVWQDGEA